MKENKVGIEFTCSSASECSDVAQWLQEELAYSCDINHHFYQSQRRGTVMLGPIEPQDLVPLLLDITYLLYGENAKVDVTSYRVYQPKR